MKMIFDDDKVSYSLETPGGNKIVVSEDESADLPGRSEWEQDNHE
jgi:hypothetical protein